MGKRKQVYNSTAVIK